MKRYVELAIKNAQRSSFRQRHGAVVVYRDQVVGQGRNYAHSSGVILDGSHAEIRALNNTTARYRSMATVYVCRLTASGELTLSKPCERCQRLMKKMGIKTVWYSNYNGDWDKLEL